MSWEAQQGARDSPSLVHCPVNVYPKQNDTYN